MSGTRWRGWRSRKTCWATRRSHRSRMASRPPSIGTGALSPKAFGEWSERAKQGRRMRVIDRLIDGCFALYELLRLALVTKLRLRGPYWNWRLHTAFGRGYPPSRWELIRAVVAYGAWVHRQ